jgi:non-heme chloroperoxidase
LIGAAHPGGLELLSANAHAARTPLLFVHGANIGAWCWAEYFLPWFAARGFPVYALSLRGHGASHGRDRLDLHGIADYADDVAAVVAGLERPPVLVGHSMGAVVVQKYLERGEAPAAVLACPVPPWGLLPSTMMLAFTRPALFAGLHSVAAGGRASLQTLAEALFADLVEPEHLARAYARMQRESNRALLDLAGFGLPQRWRMNLPRTLVLGAERDALIPHASAEGAARMLDADYVLLEGLGHGVMLDRGWERAAAAILGWLEAQGL